MRGFSEFKALGPTWRWLAAVQRLGGQLTDVAVLQLAAAWAVEPVRTDSTCFDDAIGDRPACLTVLSMPAHRRHAVTIRTELTDRLFTHCLAYLEREEAYQSELLEMVQLVRQCLIQGDVARLQTVVREAEDLGRVGAEMERERRELLAEAAVALRMPSARGLTVRRIAQHLRPDHRRRLVERAEKVRDLVERVRRLNEGNAMLVRHHLELLRQVLHTLVGEPTAGTLYGPAGEVVAPSEGAIVRTVG